MRTMVKILFISDTHTQHEGLSKALPAADIIVHAGDVTGHGSEKSVRKFLKWYGQLDYEHRIFIAGNHDWMFERNGMRARGVVKEYSRKYGEIIYLEDTGVERMGLKFWGSPISAHFGNWAFNRTEKKMAQHYAAIPDDIDVLITHNPPYMIKDYASSGSMNHVGSPSLYKEVTDRIKPEIHVFGHIHEQYGVSTIGETTFINASNLDEHYQLVNSPILMGIEVNS